MTVVFSHEKNEGWLRHAAKFGKVLGTCRSPLKPRAREGVARAARTKPARTWKDILEPGEGPETLSGLFASA